MTTNTNPQTGRPNFWTYPWQCPHNEVAFTATQTWCETCGADLPNGNV